MGIIEVPQKQKQRSSSPQPKSLVYPLKHVRCSPCPCHSRGPLLTASTPTCHTHMCSSCPSMANAPPSPVLDPHGAPGVHRQRLPSAQGQAARSCLLATCMWDVGAASSLSPLGNEGWSGAADLGAWLPTLGKGHSSHSKGQAPPPLSWRRWMAATDEPQVSF